LLPEQRMKPFAKILVPTDFSEGARAALDRALELRHRYGAALTLLHVYQMPIPYPDGYVFSADILGAIEESARNEIAKEKDRAEARARELSAGGTSPPIETKVLIGAPATAITETAQTAGHDLIVMGTHGRTGLKHLLIGSVAERVVRTAPCPVLTLR
jgi:nucleotide-binding universal stress UspA family protein